MKILAIETSCDETGIALVEVTKDDSRTHVRVLADALLSQAMLHAEYGGVYPTLAKREHANNLAPLVLETLRKAGMAEPTETPDIPQETMGNIKDVLEREPQLFVQLAMMLAQTQKPDIDVIAVTQGPGLEPALWVGVNCARALSLAWDIPIIPTNHMEGHVVAALAKADGDGFSIETPALPALSLLISGGHTELVLMKNWLEYEKIGSTRDDAVGEAFDKSARLLGLPYPGGPEISKLAAAAREESLEEPFSLPRPMLDADNIDFSFSGLKTAVRNLVEEIGEPTDEQKKQIARELEDAITEVLVEKTRRAIETHGVQILIVGGGVAASIYIIEALQALVAEYDGVQLHAPARGLATDNGLMIALCAALHTTNLHKPEDLAANGNLALGALHR